MKNRRTKLLALALSVCMTVGSFTPAVAASDVTPAASADTASVVTGAETDALASVTAGEDLSEASDDGQSDAVIAPDSEADTADTETTEDPVAADVPEETDAPEVTEDAGAAVEENAQTVNVTPDVTYAAADITWEVVSGKFQLKKAGAVLTDNAGKIVAVTYTEGTRYYTFDESGNMLTGEQTLNSKKYAFVTEASAEYLNGTTEGDKTPANSTVGSMAVNAWTQPTLTQWVYGGSDGVLDTTKIGKQAIGDYTYYLSANGTMTVDKFVKIDDTYYAFNKAGQMVVNAIYQPSTSTSAYYFQGDGTKFLGTGWQKLDGKWYYFNTSSKWVKKTGFQSLKDEDGKTYTFYFGTDGIMYQSRFYKEKTYSSSAKNQWFYFDEDGHMATGSKKVKVGSSYLYYYFRTTKGDNGEKVGSTVTGWKYFSGYWHFYSSTLKRAAYGNKIIKIASNSYYFDAQGRAFKGGYKDVGEDRYYFVPQTSKIKPYMKHNTWIVNGTKWYRALEDGKIAKGWNYIKSNWYYFNETTYVMKKSCEATRTSGTKTYKGYLDDNGRFVTNSWVKLNGNYKYLDSNQGFIKSGWKTVSGYKYYFTADGYLSQDLRRMYKGRSASMYRLYVNKSTCTVTVMTKDTTTGKFNIPVVSFLCSPGSPISRTPNGNFNATRGGRWQELMGPSYGQYGVNIYAGIIYFHSVACSSPNAYNLGAGNFNALGAPASHGCVRLCVSDAKWIYENAATSRVTIYSTGSSNAVTPPKFDKPTLPKMTASQHSDPTDPAVSGSTPSPHKNPY